MTIRALGEALGYASPVLYEHFRNKEDVLLAVAKLGFAELETALLSLAPPPGTEARILALANAYLDFARSSPERYKVMHGLNTVIDPGGIDPEIVGGELEKRGCFRAEA